MNIKLIICLSVIALAVCLMQSEARKQSILMKPAVRSHGNRISWIFPKGRRIPRVIYKPRCSRGKTEEQTTQQELIDTTTEQTHELSTAPTIEPTSAPTAELNTTTTTESAKSVDQSEACTSISGTCVLSGDCKGMDVGFQGCPAGSSCCL